MKWSTPKTLKEQLEKLWDRGDLLRELLTDTTCFPLQLKLKSPSSADITEHFSAVRSWQVELESQPLVRLECREIRHRVQGLQKVTTSAWVDSLENALVWLRKQREADQFVALVTKTRCVLPELLPWFEKRPLDILALAEDWPNLMAVTLWMIRNPRPGIYLRQADIPGVHSKFIESHRGVLTELFDLVLPEYAIDRSRTGVSQFTARYGFLNKPTHIRFRILDPSIPFASGLNCPDIALDTDSFANLRIPIKRVFITENNANFLAFPKMPESIALFGAGYGWEALSRGQWLNDYAVYYWGDIDTHGFAILNQLRARFPHVKSFLMDRKTLDQHQAFWGKEESPTQHDLSNLCKNENILYNDLRDNLIGKHLRLEQEHISFDWLGNCLKDIIADDIKYASYQGINR